MNIRPALLSINHSTGRKSPYPVDLIVVHCTEGDAASVRAWFNNPAAQVSSHYMVQKDGTVVQFVREEDTAWHAGRVHGPTASIIVDRHPANVNGYSIGIEHEGDGQHELTDAQRAASIALIRDISGRRSIPINRTHIVGHREVYALKSCPGAIDVDRLVREANGGEHPDDSDYPRAVWSEYHRDWLIVTRYAADDDWSFVPSAELHLHVDGVKASTRLSQMRTRRSDGGAPLGPPTGEGGV